MCYEPRLCAHDPCPPSTSHPSPPPPPPPPHPPPPHPPPPSPPFTPPPPAPPPLHLCPPSPPPLPPPPPPPPQDHLHHEAAAREATDAHAAADAAQLRVLHKQLAALAGELAA